MASFKKFLLSFAVIASFIFYAVSQKGSSALTAVTQNTNSENSSTNTTPTQEIVTPITTIPSFSQGQYKDGVYTGASVDAYYGFIQVKTTIAGGKITDVVFLQYPNDRGESKEISNEAMPKLKQEAIVAQSANVDIVSGATESSEAFKKSLESTLTQAKS